MIALGTMVFIGVRETPPNMQKNLENYAEESNFQDASVVSYTGLIEEDKALFESIPDLKKIEYNYEYDAYINDTTDVISLHSFPEEVSSYTVIKGRLPKSSSEIAIDETWDLKIGDKVNIRESLDEDEDEKLLNHTFIVVGKVYGPNYMTDSITKTTTLGDGLISHYGIISKDNFLLDSYNSAYLDLGRYDNYKIYDKEIRKIDRNTEDELTELFKNRPNEERDKIVKDANEEILKAEKEIQDGKDKISDAKKELLDARTTLDDGWDEYYKGVNTFNTEIKDAKNTINQNESLLNKSQKEYEDALEKYNDGIKELNDNKVLLDKGKKELENGKTTLNENQKKIDEGRSQLKEAIKTKASLESTISDLEDKKSQVEAGLDEVDINLNNLNESQNQIDLGLTEAKSGLSEISDNLETVNSNIGTIETQIESLEKVLSDLLEGSKEYEEIVSQINELKESLTTLENTRDMLEEEKVKTENTISQLESQLLIVTQSINSLNNTKNDLNINLSSIDDGLRQANDGLLQINEALKNTSISDLDKAQKELDEASLLLEEKEKEYEDGLSQYNDGLSQLKTAKVSLDNAKIQIENGLKELDSGKKDLLEAEKTGQKELDDAKKELDDGEEEYLEGKETFDEEEEKALKDIKDGEKEIEDTKKQLQILEIPDYNIGGKLSNNTFSMQLENAESFSNFALIFPLVVYIIAILVTVITMTRMVEEERTQIGTLKALGYTGSQIARKYYLYGALASILGLILGLLGGLLILLPTIFNAYFSTFLIDLRFFLPSLVNMLIVIFLAFACTLISTRSVIKSSMKEVSAELMRPKKPSKIKKSFLEHVPFLWKKLPFLWKVSFRNLAMSKAKNIMTIIGISGCTALLIMGFGIRTSVNNLADSSSISNVYNYDSICYYSEKSSDEDLLSLQNTLDENSDINYINIKADTVKVVDSDSNLIDVNLMVTDDEDTFKDYVLLRNRASGKDLSLNDNGVLISEKLSIILGLDVNDEIQVDYKGVKYNLKIKGITEQYVEHTIITSSSYFERLSGSKYIPNTYLLKYKDGANTEEINSMILDNDTTQAIVSVSEIKGTLDSLTKSLDIVVYVIIILSALLTFVVLFNLSNLNISERRRELSTVKVLGFKPIELTLYMFRETVILAIFSLFLGLFLGKALHYAIVVVLPPGAVLLDIRLYAKDVITSLIIASIFVIITIIIFHRKLKKIDMVEALKAIE